MRAMMIPWGLSPASDHLRQKAAQQWRAFLVSSFSLVAATMLAGPQGGLPRSLQGCPGEKGAKQEARSAGSCQLYEACTSNCCLALIFSFTRLLAVPNVTGDICYSFLCNIVPERLETGAFSYPTAWASSNCKLLNSLARTHPLFSEHPGVKDYSCSWRKNHFCLLENILVFFFNQ